MLNTEQAYTSFLICASLWDPLKLKLSRVNRKMLLLDQVKLFLDKKFKPSKKYLAHAD